MTNATSSDMHHCSDHVRISVFVPTIIGVLVLGLFIGFCLSMFLFKKWSPSKKRAFGTNSGSYRVSRDVEPNGVNNRFYIYGNAPDSSIYGTPDTYLTQEERRQLGMGNVMKHTHTQTDPIEEPEPPSYKQREETDYDYTFTYVMYQNVIQKLMCPKRKASVDPEVHYVNEFFCQPEVLLCPRSDSSAEEEEAPRKQTTKKDWDCDSEDSPDYPYINPNLIHPKKEKKPTSRKTTVDRAKGECRSGSDSDSESEKELVDDYIMEYAHSLSVKANTRERTEFSMSVKTNKTGTGQKPLQSKRSRQKVSRKDTDKSRYMVMELTPEIWEILQSHTKSMKAAKAGQKHPSKPSRTEEPAPPPRPPRAASYHRLNNAQRDNRVYSNEEDEENYIKVIE